MSNFLNTVMTSLPKEEQLLSIQEASKLLKVSKKTLRRWENAGKLVPLRTEGGHRRYDPENIRKFKASKQKRKYNRKSEQVEPIDTVSNSPSIIFADDKPTITEKVNKLPNWVSDDQFVSDESFKMTLPSRKFSVAFATVLLLATAAISVARSAQNLSIPANIAGILRLKDDNNQLDIDRKQVLADNVVAFNPEFVIAVPSRFEETASFSGDIISPNDTFNLLNDTVATLNIGGDATEVNIGADTGTTTINNALTQLAGTLDVGGNSITSPGDLVIDPTGGGTSIGDGTADQADLEGGDLFVTGDLEVDGTAYLTTIVMNSDTVTDFTGTGIQVSGGALSATLGTSISSSEIEDATILAVDLNTTNTAVNGYSLTYDSTSGGFTWVDSSGSNLFTDGGTYTYLTQTTDDLLIGASAGPLGKLSVIGDSDEVQFAVRGNGTQTSNLFILEQSDGTDVFTISNTGAFTIGLDGSLYDFSAITHDDSAAQGIKLPQAALLTNLAGAAGEGYIAYDTTQKKARIWNGSAWTDISGASTTLQESYDNDINGSDVAIVLNTDDDSLIFRNQASGGTDSAYTLLIDNLATGSTTSDYKNLYSSASGSYNTTGSTLTNYGAYIANDSTRSAGGNALTNIGLYARATGAQNNVAAAFEYGNVGIGTTSPTAYLDVAASTTSQASLRLRSGVTPSSPNIGDVYADGTDIFYYNGSWIDLTDTGAAGIDGTGIAQHIPYWSDSNTLTNSLIYQSGSNIGIGTTNPGAKLEVSGDIYLSKEVNRTIKLVDTTTATVNGADLSILGANGGTGGSTVRGGNISITSGAATSSGGTGGTLNLTGGSATASSGPGGAVDITGGATSATGIGGAVTIAGGVGGSSAGTGGAVTVRGGDGTTGNSGGALILRGGNGTGSNKGGNVTITGGTGGTVGTAGNVTITSGAGGSSSGNSGTLILNTGTVTLGTVGDILFMTGGNMAGAFDENQNLGIGTTIPAAKLDVKGTAWLRGSGSSWGAYVNSSGNVGIGTTNPAQKLSIAGDLGIRDASGGFYTTFTGGTQANDVDYTLPTDYAGANDYVLTSTTGGVLAWKSVSGAGGAGGVGGTGTDNRLTRWSASGADIEDSSINDLFTNNVAITIDSLGRTGIGSTSPTAMLSVGLGNQFTVDSSGNLAFANAATIDLAASTAALNIENGLLNIDSTNYRVGIGTSSPSYTLDVLGDLAIGETGSSPQFRTIFRGGDQAGDITYTLPTAVAAGNNYVLTSQTDGTLAWQDVTGAGGIDGTGIAQHIPYWSDSNTLTNSVIYQTAGGNIGIGTTSPQAKLDVYGTAWLRGSGSSWGAYVNSSGNVGIGTTNPGSLLSLTKTYSNPANVSQISNTSTIDDGDGTTGGIFYNALNQTTFTGSDTQHSIYALANQSTLSSGSAVNVYGSANFITLTGTTGVTTLAAPNYNFLAKTSSGTVAAGYASSNYIQNTSGGTITNASTLRGQLLSNTATITNFRGLEIANISNSGGTIANTYGIWIGDLSTGTQTNAPYSLFASDVNAKSYFAGNVGIGVSAPSYLLDVRGEARIQQINTIADNNLVLTSNSGVLSSIDTTNWDKDSTNDLDGTGIAQHIPYWSDSNTLTNSVIYQTAGGNVGIGTTSSSTQLTVGGELTVNTINSVGDNNLVLTSNSGVVSAIDTTNWDKNSADDFAGISGTDNRLARFNAAGDNVEDSSFNDLFTAGVALTLDANGYLGIGNTSPSYSLDVIDQARIGNLPSSSSDTVVTSNSGVLESRAIDSRVWGSSLVDGTGIAQHIPYWSDTDTLTNSIIYQTAGGNIGVGTTSPQAKLDVYGTAWLRGSGSSWGAYVDSSGQVGIGTTSPSQTLTLNGDFGIIEGGSSPQFYTIFQGGDQTQDVTYTLPTDYPGDNNYVLTSQTNGTLSWTSVSGAGGLDAVNPQANHISYFSDSDTLTSSVIYQSSGGNIGIGNTNPLSKLSVAHILEVDDSNYRVGIGTSSPSYTLDIKGELAIGETGSSPQFSTVFQGGDQAGDITYTLPTAGAAANNYVLTSQTDGTLSWQSVSGAGGLDGTGIANHIPYWSDSDTLTNSLIYQSGSNIGIGTTSPQAKLDVLGTAWLRGSGSSWGAYVDSSGNVGIGHTSPTAYLDLAAATTSQASLRIRDGSAPSSPNSGDIYADGTDIFYRTSGGSWVDLTDAGGSTTISGGLDNRLARFNAAGDNVETAAIYDATTGGQIAIGIDSSGNVGIGTTSPQTKLDVYGTAWLRGSGSSWGAYVNSSGNVGIGTTNPTHTLTLNGNLGIQDASGGFYTSFTGGTQANNVDYTLPTDYAAGNNYVLASQTDGTLSWQDISGIGGLDGTGIAQHIPYWSDSNTLSNSILYQTVAGNIGIGTTSPAAKFQINPTSAGTAFVVNTSGQVGIGTTSPTVGRQLDVIGDIRTTNSILLDNVAAAGSEGIEFDTGDEVYSIWANPNNNGLILNANPLGTASRYDLVIRGTTGNQGIIGMGLNAPSSAKLEIRETSIAALRLSYDTNTDTRYQIASDGGLTQTFRGTDADYNLDFSTATDGDFSVNGNDLFVDTSLSRVGIGTSSPSQLFQVGPSGTTGSGAFVVDTFGTVGIGTTSPSTFKLQVAGHIGPTFDDTYDLGSSSLRWRDLYLGPTSLHIGVNGNEGIIGYDTANSRLVFDSDGDGTTDLTVSDTGRLGVGTTAPTQRFQINESGTSAFVVDGNGWLGIGTTSPTSAVTVADGKLIDLSAIKHDDSAAQGLKLPQNTTLANLGAAAGEGYIAYDSTDKKVKTWNGTIWTDISGASTTLQEAYDAGNTINVNSGQGDLQFTLASADFWVNNWGGNVGIGATSPLVAFDVAGESWLRGAQDNFSGLFVNTSGNVGIGHTSPTAYLDLAASTTSQASLRIRDGVAPSSPNTGDIYADGTDIFYRSSGGWVDLTAGGGTTISGGLDNRLARFNAAGDNVETGSIWDGTTDGSIRLGIASNGDIGIGTTNPSSTLSVAGSFNVTGNSTIGDATGDTITFNADSWSTANDISFNLNGSTTAFSLENGLFNVDSTNFRIGIGDSSPSATLDIAGNLNIQTIGTIADNNLVLTSNSGVVSAIDTTNWDKDSTNDLDGTGIANHIPYWSDSNTLTNSLIYQTGSNIGIGTTSPQAKLDVLGTTWLRGSGSSWGVYVNSSGNVGIGTTNPNQQLEITGNFRLPATTASTGIIYSDSNTLLHTFGTNSFYAGISAGNLTNSASANTGVGNSALASVSGGDSNTAFGYRALTSNSAGNQNTALGWLALEDNTGHNNTAIGAQALANNLGGSSNIAIGIQALLANTTGSNNNALGFQALNDSTGSNNNAFGYEALENVTGAANTAIGHQTGLSVNANGNISNNTLVGYQAGTALITGGSNNVLLGYGAGDNLTSGSSNIVLGYDVEAPSATSTQTLNIGNLIFGTGLDGTGTTLSSGSIGIGIKAPQTKLNVLGTGWFATGAAGQGLYVNSSSLVGIGTTSPTAYADLAAATTSNASLRVRAGSAPSVPNEGDIYADGTDIFYRTSGGSWVDLTQGGGSSEWTLSSTELYPNTAATTNVLIGDTTVGGADIYLGADGAAIFNQNGASVDFRFEGDTDEALLFGDGSADRIGIGTSDPQGKFHILSTTTQMRLGYSGAKFTDLSVDSSGYLTIAPNGTTAATFADNQITLAQPTQFTAAGDVSLAYDLQFTNASTANIKSSGPLAIAAGETFNSDNLTLSAYNSGDVVLAPGSSGTTINQGQFSVDDSQDTLPVDATTPDVSGSSFFITANTTSTTISNFVSAPTGTVLYVEVNDTNTGFDCTSSNLNCGTGDFAASTEVGTGDVFSWIFDGTNWNLLSWLDTSRDISASTTGFDIAELFPSNDSLEAGEVVVVDPNNTEQVLKSDGSYQKDIIGIVSTQPGITLGEGDDGFYPIALAGRVPVKVSGENGAINAGDFLATSSIFGHAMKATEAGMVVGTAMESWNPANPTDTGVVTVFVNITYADPSITQTLAEQTQVLNNIEGDVELLSSLISTDEAGVNKLTIDDIQATDLTVLGDTLLSDTVINGKLNIGTLEITESSIDSIGVLEIQPLQLGDVELQGGLVKITTDGNVEAVEVTAEKYNVSGASAGTGLLPQGDKEVFISTDQVTDESLIFVTPKAAVSFPLSVTTKDAGQGFTVEIAAPHRADVEFDWWIVDRKNQ